MVLRAIHTEAIYRLPLSFASCGVDSDSPVTLNLYIYSHSHIAWYEWSLNEWSLSLAGTEHY